MVPANPALFDFDFGCSIGMPSYSTYQYSATYAQFCRGRLHYFFKTQLGTYLRAIFVVDATVLATGILPTQAQAPGSGHLSACYLALTGSRRSCSGMQCCWRLCHIAIEPGLARSPGGARPKLRFDLVEFIELIAARPLVGYGSFSRWASSLQVIFLTRPTICVVGLVSRRYRERL